MAWLGLCAWNLFLQNVPDRITNSILLHLNRLRTELMQMHSKLTMLSSGQPQGQEKRGARLFPLSVEIKPRGTIIFSHRLCFSFQAPIAPLFSFKIALFFRLSLIRISLTYISNGKTFIHRRVETVRPGFVFQKSNIKRRGAVGNFASIKRALVTLFLKCEIRVFTRVRFLRLSFARTKHQSFNLLFFNDF